MFAAQTTIAGLMVPLINPQQVQQNFAFSANTPDQELNGFTPMVAFSAAQIIVSSLATQHPLRVNAMNILGANAYANNEFRTFVNHVMRIALALFETQQIGSINQVVQQKLPEYVQQYSAVLAMHNQQVMAILDQNTMIQVQQMAAAWMNTVQQAEQIIAQVMQRNQAQGGFGGQQMQYGNGQGINGFGTSFGGVNTGAPASNISGVFSNSHAGGGGAPGAAGRTSRFHEKLAAEQQHATEVAIKQQANERGTSIMEEPATILPTVTLASAGVSYKERLLREVGAVSGLVDSMPKSVNTDEVATRVSHAESIISKQAAASVAAAAQFGSHIVTPDQPVHTSKVYERAMIDARSPEEVNAAAAAIMTNPVDLVEKKKVLQECVVNGHNLQLVAILRDVSLSEANWKPSKFQPHFPAWCRRTHEIMYMVDIGGDVVAVPTIYEDEKISAMFEYSAHALDKTKGLPDTAPDVPVRPEAKILYSTEKNPEVGVTISPNYISATSVDDLAQQALADAVVALAEDDKISFYAASGISHQLVTSQSAEANTKSYEQVRAVFLEVSLASAAEAIAKVTPSQLRRKIDGLFTGSLNNLLQLELGLDAGIKSFELEAGTIIADVTEAFGSEFGDILGKVQAKFVGSVLDAALPIEVSGHHENMIDGKEETVKRISECAFYLMTNGNVLVSRFTDDELALGMAPTGASQLSQDAYPLLYAAIRKYYESDIGKNARSRTIILSTIDGSLYKISDNPLNPAMYLVMAAD